MSCDAIVDAPNTDCVDHCRQR